MKTIAVICYDRLDFMDWITENTNITPRWGLGDTYRSYNVLYAGISRMSDINGRTFNQVLTTNLSNQNPKMLDIYFLIYAHLVKSKFYFGR